MQLPPEVLDELSHRAFHVGNQRVTRVLHIRIKIILRLHRRRALQRGIDPAEALLETWLRRRTYRVKPAADVHLGVGFTTVMPGSRRLGSLRIPSLHGKLGIST